MLTEDYMNSHVGTFESIQHCILKSAPVGVDITVIQDTSRKLKPGQLLVTITEPDYSKKPWWKFW